MHAAPLPDTASPTELARLAPFDALGREARHALLERAGTLELATRASLFEEGVEAAALYVVLEGCIERYARAAKRESTLAIARAGETLPLAAVLREAPTLSAARACAPARVLAIPASDVRAALAADARFARALVRRLARDQRQLTRACKELRLRTAVQRLANRLLRYAREQGEGELVLPCDKRTLASLLAMTPENLSRAFATLGAQGVVVEGRTIRLTDPAALRRLARPDPLIDGRDG